MVLTAIKTVVLGVAVVWVSAGSVYGQQKAAATDQSLGDFARRVRAEKAKEPKPVRVVTNDNLPGADEAAFGSASKEKGAAPASAEPPSPPSPATHDEAYFRSQLRTLQGNLDTHQRELAVLQQKLGQNQLQYYPDPNKTLQQEYSRSDIDKLTAEINAKKQQLDDDQKAIDDLHEQLRREGGDPGWLR